jgi:hypothetical protein
MIERLKSEGKNEEAIRQALQEKAEKSIEKYGNKSKIGMLLNQKNADLLQD